MANPSSVSYEQFAQVADGLVAEGKKPTVRSTREALGNTGGHDMISRYLKRWQEATNRLEQVADLKLDPSIAKAINHFLLCKLEEANEEAKAEISKLQKEVDELNVENECFANQVNEKSAAIADLVQQNGALTGRIQQLVADAERAASVLVVERHATEIARLELAKSELRLESVQGIIAELENTKNELIQVKIYAAELKGELASIKSK